MGLAERATATGAPQLHAEVLSAAALERLRRQHCVIRHGFLDASEAAALHDEFVRLSDDDGSGG